MKGNILGMLQAYLEEIKPLNDQLGERLGMNTIAIKQQSTEQEIRVKVWVKTHQGTEIVLDNTQLRDLRALGLMI